jgi:hypothetical protein
MISTVVSSFAPLRAWVLGCEHRLNLRLSQRRRRVRKAILLALTVGLLRGVALVQADREQSRQPAG